jgi:hypothetical protein
MNISIDKFKEAGNYDKERVLLKVDEDTALGNFMVARTKRAGSSDASEIDANVVQDVYWFPEQDVKSGDFIVVYTCQGVDRSFANRTGTNTHIFHLGKDSPIWNENADSVLLLEVNEWRFLSLLQDDSAEEEEVTPASDSKVGS